MDGAFSDNLPTLDENTITVSPFCGESDICPRDQSSQLFHVNWANTSIEISKQNMNRFCRILFPSKPLKLSAFCQQGFDDALRFLHKNNLISCTRCLAVQSIFTITNGQQKNSVDEQQKQKEDLSGEDYDPECEDCTKYRMDALYANMPDTVLSVFQTYIDSANKGIANWIFYFNGRKILKTIVLPATKSMDLLFIILTKYVLISLYLNTIMFYNVMLQCSYYLSMGSSF